VTGAVATEEELLSPDYWVRHVRQPVRYADAVSALVGQNVGRYLELGPDGTLTALAQSGVPSDDGLLFTPLLHKTGPDESRKDVNLLGDTMAMRSLPANPRAS